MTDDSEFAIFIVDHDKKGFACAFYISIAL